MGGGVAAATPPQMIGAAPALQSKLQMSAGPSGRVTVDDGAAEKKKERTAAEKADSKKKREAQKKKRVAKEVEKEVEKRMAAEAKAKAEDEGEDEEEEEGEVAEEPAPEPESMQALNQRLRNEAMAATIDNPWTYPPSEERSFDPNQGSSIPTTTSRPGVQWPRTGALHVDDTEDVGAYFDHDAGREDEEDDVPAVERDMRDLDISQGNPWDEAQRTEQNAMQQD